jgi:hypothetical protein
MDEARFKAVLEDLPKDELVSRLLRWEVRRNEAEEYLLSAPGRRAERVEAALDILIERGWRFTKLATMDVQIYVDIQQEQRDGHRLKDAIAAAAQRWKVTEESANRMYYREKQRRTESVVRGDSP